MKRLFAEDSGENKWRGTEDNRHGQSFEDFSVKGSRGIDPRGRIQEWISEGRNRMLYTVENDLVGGKTYATGKKEESC